MKKYLGLAYLLLLMSAVTGCDLLSGLFGGSIDAPLNLGATDGTEENRVVISWDLVDGADKYMLERSADSLNFEIIDSDAASPYLDDAITGANTNLHYYRVKAIKFNGQNTLNTVSDYSDVDSGYAGLPSAILIPQDVWYVGSIPTAGFIQFYNFNSVSNNTYTIYSDDSDLGTGTYANEINITAYRSDEIGIYFTNGYSMYYLPKTITALDDTVILKVYAYSSGDFAIKVSNH